MKLFGSAAVVPTDIRGYACLEIDYHIHSPSPPFGDTPPRQASENPEDEGAQPAPDFASESSSILSTAATDGSSVPGNPSAPPLANGFGAGEGDGCVRECTASRGRQSR